ncbi:MAG: glutamate racemase [Clostridiales bacterium]|nr:glutamate racemase [Clostridiales bacterium]
MSCDLPIGVFDSGVGGLTVAKEIMKQLPSEQIIYFGDTARVPYGSKSKETVTMYSRQIIRFLLTKDVKAIVIACNTATAFALDTVKEEFNIPIIGVVKPGAKAAAKTTKNGKIGVIGTQGTIASGIYNDVLSGISENLHVYGKACPLFVPLVEEGWIDDPVTREVAARYINELMEKDIDTLVMGCTHYPLLRQVIRQIVGSEIDLVNPAYETARTLRMELMDRGLTSDSKRTCDHMFFVSDGAEKFRNFANTILPCEIIETKDVNIKTFE